MKANKVLLIVLGVIMCCVVTAIATAVIILVINPGNKGLRGNAPEVPDGWVKYEHTVNCSANNTNLTLDYFQIQTPNFFTSDNCIEAPSSPNYVSFYKMDGGYLSQNIGVGYYSQGLLATDELRYDLIDQLVEDFRNAAPGSLTITEVSKGNVTLLEKDYMKKDFNMNLSEASFGFSAGEYLLRVVLVENHLEENGLLILQIAKTDDISSFSQFDSGDMQKVLESIRFEKNS